VSDVAHGPLVFLGVGWLFFVFVFRFFGFLFVFAPINQDMLFSNN
jgi:hypothetical protein